MTKLEKCAAHTLSDMVTRDRFVCSLVRWDFVYTLEIIARTLSEVVNRERLCVTNALLSVASARLAA